MKTYKKNNESDLQINTQYENSLQQKTNNSKIFVTK